MAVRGMLSHARPRSGSCTTGQAAAFLDALDADGPVAVRPGEDDGRRARAMGVGQ